MSKLRHRRPSPALAVALVALFVALGGTGYAAVTVTGKDIRDNTIASADLRDNGVLGRDVRADALTGADINESTLGRVPAAGSADRAASAATATTAGRALSADRATSAETATSAGRAASADTARTAETAAEAGKAKTADRATNADRATTAQNASAATLATRAFNANIADRASNADVAKLALNVMAAAFPTVNSCEPDAVVGNLGAEKVGNTCVVDFGLGRPLDACVITATPLNGAQDGGGEVTLRRLEDGRVKVGHYNSAGGSPTAGNFSIISVCPGL
jgi:hypothetical protein